MSWSAGCSRLDLSYCLPIFFHGRFYLQVTDKWVNNNNTFSS